MENVRPGTIQRLAWACMIAALLTGVLQGLWEMVEPILTSEEAFAGSSSGQRWGYGILAVFKSAGFLAGLFGLYRLATRQGWILKIFISLAAIGGIFFAAVWLVMAANAHFTLLYVLGGMWYQMIAPVALGIASLHARLVPWWMGVYSIILGILNSQIFAVLGADNAMIVQGVIWMIFGYLVYAVAARQDTFGSTA